MWWTLSAAAGGMSTIINDDGWVQVEATVDAPVSEVTALLADPLAGQLSSDVIRVEVQSPGQPCTIIRVTTKGLTRPLVYTAKRCVTAKGVSETLLSSDDFTTLEAHWAIAPVGLKTQVRYRSRTEVDLMVPKSLVRRGQANAAKEMMRNLESAAQARGPKE